MRDIPIYSHAGDLGDTIYALPVLRQMPGHLRLCRNGRYPVRERYTSEKAERVKDFFLSQPYVLSCQYSPIPIGVEMDKWRRNCNWNGRLIDKVCKLHGVEPPDTWLTCANPIEVAPVVIHRSERYVQWPDMWEKVMQTYKDKVFVGFKKEHDIFQSKFGKVPFLDCSFADMFRVIAGAKLYCGNTSAGSAMAVGMGKKCLIEYSKGNPTGMFPSGVYWTGTEIDLPSEP